MNKYIDSVISVIKAEGLDPLNKTDVVDSLSQCVCSDKLVSTYIDNMAFIARLKYSYE